MIKCSSKFLLLKSFSCYFLIKLSNKWLSNQPIAWFFVNYELKIMFFVFILATFYRVCKNSGDIFFLNIQNLQPKTFSINGLFMRSQNHHSRNSMHPFVFSILSNLFRMACLRIGWMVMIFLWLFKLQRYKNAILWNNKLLSNCRNCTACNVCTIIYWWQL